MTTQQYEYLFWLSACGLFLAVNLAAMALGLPNWLHLLLCFVTGWFVAWVRGNRW